MSLRFDFWQPARYALPVKCKLSLIALALLCVALPACDRDAASTATPAETSHQNAPTPPASEQKNLEASLPSEGSTCPEGKGPGDQWKVDCNTCFCSPEGKVACTLVACLDE